MSGTAIAQAISVLVSPVLTRIYGPADFGVFALYLSIVTIASVAATGRYELAILIPASDREAFDLVLAAVGIAFIVNASALVLLSGAWLLGVGLGQATTLRGLIYLLPVGAFLAAAYQGLSYWSNRKKKYKRLVASRILQSAAMSAFQGGVGFGGAGSLGLVGGHLLGQASAGLMLLRRTLIEDRALIEGSDRRAIVVTARRHSNFPVFLVPGHLANAISSQLPVMLLAVLFGPGVAGLYSLADRVMVLPSSVIGSAIGDVYRQQAAHAYNEFGECRELFLRTAKRLAVTAALPCVLIILGGPVLFAMVFGEQWRTSGQIASLLAMMVFFQMVSSPLSQTVLLAGMQRLDMLWQMVRLAAAAGSIYLGFRMTGKFMTSVVLYVAVFAVLHVVHSLMQYRAACGRHAAVPGGSQ